MNKSRLVFRSLYFYRRTNLGILLGAALAATVLTGALMVGDSVRHSLKQLTLSRLGAADFVMVSAERLFRSDLADRMNSEGTFHTTPILILDGVAVSPEGDRRINQVQVIGVDDDFWSFAPQPEAAPAMQPGVCWVNRAFADRMFSGKPTEPFILRVRKPGGLPADMTLAVRDDDVWSRRLQVGGILDASAFGHFTLRITQIPPPTVFLPLSWLHTELETEDRANVLLVSDPDGRNTVAKLQETLDRQWRLDDAGLRTVSLPDESLALMSDQVFLAQTVVDAGTRGFPTAQPVMTWFVNRITAAGRETPYSFAMAPGPPRVPETLADDEILINDWLARDLDLTAGDSVTIAYYVVDTGSRLEEASATLTVAGIVPLEDVTEIDRRLAPHIPGLSDVADCRDWRPGIPIDLERIRDKDEAYWDDYGSTPKLYLTRAAAERLWRNRFGTATALRFPASSTDPENLEAKMRSQLHARDLGFVVHAAKAEGLDAGRQAVDFGGLFVGLSFFLIAAAILLTVLLFAFNLQYRQDETGTFRALGFSPSAVRRLWLAEGMALVTLGALTGGALAVGYNALALRALGTLWIDAVRTSAFHVHVRPLSVAIGVAGVIAAAALSMLWTIRKQIRSTIRALHHHDPEDPLVKTRRRWVLILGWIAIAGALAILLSVSAGRGREAMGAFFGAGALLLFGLLMLCRAGCAMLASSSRMHRRLWGVRGLILRPGRSLACIALLALGVFLVIAVAANRHGPVRDVDHPASGTGGYRIWGQTTLPLAYDLNSERGRAKYGIERELMKDVRVTALRLREGDDASCLNLNRITRPHLLGVDPREFDRRGAFLFAQSTSAVDPDHPWRILDKDLGAEIIPVVADAADIVWGLGKSVGDTLTYHDEEGREFQLKIMAGLANSVLQGHLIMAESRMLERFPSQTGARVLLIEAPADLERRVQGELTNRLSDFGMACVPTRQRLAEFNSVENTYLSIFMMLGGMGLLVGSAGMGLVAARNILERRPQLALLRAVGFRRRQVWRLLFAEHGALAGAGIGIGAAAALVAVMPALLAPGTVPWGGMAVTLAVILSGSLLWIWLAVYFALRGELMTALREE